MVPQDNLKNDTFRRAYSTYIMYVREAFKNNKLKSLKVAQVKDEMDDDEDDGCDGVCDVVC